MPRDPFKDIDWEKIIEDAAARELAKAEANAQVIAKAVVDELRLVGALAEIADKKPETFWVKVKETGYWYELPRACPAVKLGDVLEVTGGSTFVICEIDLRSKPASLWSRGSAKVVAIHSVASRWEVGS